MEIWGHSGSGNCMKVKLVCDYLSIPYTWKDVDLMAQESRQPEFLNMNPMGQVPVIKLEDGRTLAQSNAIIKFLARDSDLIPETPFECALVDQWLFWEQYSHEPHIATRRFYKVFLKKKDDEIAPSFKEKGDAALDLMESHLSKQDYFVGSHITIADISLFAYTRWADEGGFSLKDRPHVAQWLKRISKGLKLAV